MSELYVRTNVRRNRPSLLLLAAALAGALGAVACNRGDLTAPSPTSSGTTTTTSAPPTVTAISPTSGGDAGGTYVTITGTNFALGATVKIGGVSATTVSVLTSTSLTCYTGTHDVGLADVQVTVGPNSATLPAAYQYLGAQNTVMTFRAWNHTGGKLGEWTTTGTSGTSMTLTVDTLGQELDGDGNVVRPAVPVATVDSKRMVLRKVGTGGRMGDYVVMTTNGSLTFNVPYATRQDYDIFLMNANNGTDYTLADAGYLTYARVTTVSRGADTGGATGGDALINRFATELDRAVAMPWMRYGQVSRTGADGEIFVSYTAPNGGSCMTYTRSKGFLYINPPVCTTNAVDMEALSLQYGFEMLIGLSRVWGTDSSAAVDPVTKQITASGRDLLAYVFLKDFKTW